MWVITAFSTNNTTIYEFDQEHEARQVLENLQGCKILSEVVYFNDPAFANDIE